jgi:Cupin domain
VAEIESKNFAEPDETHPFGSHGKTEFVDVAGRLVGRSTMEPDWKWSRDVKPIVGTDSCETAHFGYVVSGRLRITLNDGTVSETSPGDIVSVPPGHDAEVIGDEPYVFIDFANVAEFAIRGGGWAQR